MKYLEIIGTNENIKSTHRKAGNISIQNRLRKVQSKWGRYDGEIGRA